MEKGKDFSDGSELSDFRAKLLLGHSPWPRLKIIRKCSRRGVNGTRFCYGGRIGNGSNVVQCVEGRADGALNYVV